jgi:ankyrin repeat protein
VADGTLIDDEKAVHNLVVAASSNPERLKNLKESGISIDAKNGFGETALHIAACMGNLKAMETLIDAGADKDAMSNACMTPIGHCLVNTNPEGVELLLKRGANPDALIDTDIAPLSLAVTNGDEKISRLLLGHKACMQPAKPSTDQHAAITAARCGYLPILRMLIEEFGAPVDIATDAGETPLASAAAGHHHACFDYLLEKGADINFVNAQKLTPIYAAACANNSYAIEEFLKRGVGVNGIPNDGGWTPLMSAANTGALKAARVLLEKGADIATVARDSVWKGMDARKIAETNEYPAMVALIDAESRKRHLLAVENDAAAAHDGVKASVRVRKPLGFRKSQP